MIKIELTEEEAEVLSNYLDRKLYRLEEAGLTDAVCYSKLYSIKHKISLQKNKNTL